MTTVSIHDPPWADTECVRTSKTIDAAWPQDACVPTRPPVEWPRENFLAWLDALKKRLRVDNDSQLADRLGIGHYLISSWRSGKQRPSWEILRDVAQALEEDVRPIWVRAGLITAAEVGIDDAVEPAPADLPHEIQRLVDVYADPRMDDPDRSAMLHAVRMVYLGVLADLEQRDAPSPIRGRRVS